MKKVVFLLAFFFIGMITFANSVPTNNSLKTASTTYTETVNSYVNSNGIANFLNKVDVNQEQNVLENYTVEPSCTVTAHISIGYNGTGLELDVSATAATCKEALQMILDMISILE